LIDKEGAKKGASNIRKKKIEVKGVRKYKKSNSICDIDGDVKKAIINKWTKYFNEYGYLKMNEDQYEDEDQNRLENQNKIEIDRTESKVNSDD